MRSCFDKMSSRHGCGVLSTYNVSTHLTTSGRRPRRSTGICRQPFSAPAAAGRRRTRQFIDRRVGSCSCVRDAEYWNRTRFYCYCSRNVYRNRAFCVHTCTAYNTPRVRTHVDQRRSFGRFRSTDVPVYMRLISSTCKTHH